MTIEKEEIVGTIIAIAFPYVLLYLLLEISKPAKHEYTITVIQRSDSTDQKATSKRSGNAASHQAKPFDY